MKLFTYILSIVILFTTIYYSIFCFFYGMAMEDGMSMFMSALFTGIAYYWNMAIKPFKNKYTIKIINLIKILSKEDDC